MEQIEMLEKGKALAAEGCCPDEPKPTKLRRVSIDHRKCPLSVVVTCIFMFGCLMVAIVIVSIRNAKLESVVDDQVRQHKLDREAAKTAKIRDATKFVELEDHIDAIKKWSQGYNERFNRVVSKLERLEEAVNRMSPRLTTISRQIDETNEEVGRRRDSLTAITEDLQQLRLLNEKMDGRLSEVSEQNAESKTALTERVDKLTAELLKIYQENSAKTNEAAELAAAIAQLRKEAEQQEFTVSSITNEIRQMKQDQQIFRSGYFNELWDKVDKLIADGERKNSSLTAFSDEMTTIQAANREQAHKLAEMSRELGQLRTNYLVMVATTTSSTPIIVDNTFYRRPGIAALVSESNRASGYGEWNHHDD